MKRVFLKCIGKSTVVKIRLVKKAGPRKARKIGCKEDLYAGSQAPAWEPSEQSSSFANREAGASRTEFPSGSLGTSTLARNRNI